MYGTCAYACMPAHDNCFIDGKVIHRRPTHEMHVHECHHGSGLGTSTVRRPRAKQSMPAKAFREGAIRKTMG